MFNKRLIAAVVLVLATALSGCGGDSDDKADETLTSGPKPTPTETVSAQPVPSPTLGSLTVTPGAAVKDQQKVKIDIAGFGKFTGPVGVVLCTPEVAGDPGNPTKYCDTRPASAGQVEVTKGVGSGSITIQSGTSFEAGLATSKCDPGGKCLVLATSSGEVPEFVGIAEVSFAG